MRYIASLRQLPDRKVALTLFRGQKRYTEILTAEQADALGLQLLDFTTRPQEEPFYLLGVK